MNLTNQLPPPQYGNLIINVCMLVGMIVLTIYIIRIDRKTTNESYGVESSITANKDIDTNTVNVSTVSFKTDNDKKNFRNTIDFENQCKTIADKRCNSIITEKLKTYHSDYTNNLLDMLFPVGYIYITASSTQPSWMSKFGEWKEIGTDRPRFLVSVGKDLTVDKDGGYFLDKFGLCQTGGGLCGDAWYGGRCFAALGGTQNSDTSDVKVLSKYDVDTIYPPFHVCHFYQRKK